MRRKIVKYYYSIKRMNKWSKYDIEQWQRKKLQELVYHFYHNTIYYKRLFKQIGLHPEDIRSIDDLKKIPTINKGIMRSHFAELVPNNINRYPHRWASTGGSTGNPLRYYLDYKSWSYTTSAKIYAWQTTSYLYGDSYAALGSSSLFPTENKSWKNILYFFMRNGVALNGMNLSDEKLEEYVTILIKQKVKYLYGYAAALYLLAKYCNKNNVKLHILGCFSTSEILTVEYRNEMIKAFGGFVMDCYGARDGGLTAYEINTSEYHVGYNSIAEITNSYAPECGSLLVTDLLNYTFPFIRYDIGDEVELTTQSSYNGQVFKKVFGRNSDIIRLENGRNLTGVGFNVMFKNLNVIAFRIKKTGKLNIEVEIQKGFNYSSSEEKLILDTFIKHAGEDCNVKLKYVEEFLANPNGKRNYFITSNSE